MKPITLSDFAERMWKALHGDKTYEQVEQEFEEYRLKRAHEILANLPFKKQEKE
jgi:hypothetical protein